jgi:hypothetical protein
LFNIAARTRRFNIGYRRYGFKGLREKQGLRVIENRVMRGIFGPASNLHQFGSFGRTGRIAGAIILFENAHLIYIVRVFLFLYV